MRDQIILFKECFIATLQCTRANMRRLLQFGAAGSLLLLLAQIPMLLYLLNCGFDAKNGNLIEFISQLEGGALVMTLCLGVLAQLIAMCVLSGLVRASMEILAGAQPPLKTIFDCADSFGRLSMLFAVMNLVALVPMLLLGSFGGIFPLIALTISSFAVLRLMLAVVPVSGSDMPLKEAVSECVVKTAKKPIVVLMLMGFAITAMLLSVYSLGITNIITLPFTALLLTNIYRKL